VINVTMDHQLHNGWSMDHQALPPADVFIAASADTVVASLLAQLPRGDGDSTQRSQPAAPTVEPGPIRVPRMIHELRAAVG
jgi:hypothetical protein